MLEQVIQIIRGQLEEPGLALSAQTNLLTDLQLNSLELVELVCALEDAFEEGAILPDAGEEDEVLSITLDN